MCSPPLDFINGGREPISHADLNGSLMAAFSASTIWQRFWEWRQMEGLMRRGSVVLLFGLVVVYHLAELMRVPPSPSGESPAAVLTTDHQAAPVVESVATAERLRVPAGHSLVVSSLDESASGHLIDIRVVNARVDTIRLRPERTIQSEGCYPRMSDPPKELLAAVVADGDGSARRFCVPLFSNALSADRFLIGQRLAMSNRVQVYAEESLYAELTFRQTLIQQSRRLCFLAETESLDRVAQLVGPVADPDADERLTILICSLTETQPTLMSRRDEGRSFNRQQSTAPPIHGCVRETDFSGQPDPFTGDIVYLNLSVLGEIDHRAILSHEITHAALFSAILQSGSLSGIPGWLNEAIAHVVEQNVSCFSPNLADRMHVFQMDTARVPLIMDSSQVSLTTRRGPSRAAGCLFISWLLRNHPSVTPVDLATTAGDGVRRIESLTGCRFARLFAEWSAELAARNQVRKRVLHSGRHHLIGTAFVAFQPLPHDCEVELRSDARALLKVAVVPATSIRLTERPQRTSQN